MRTFLWSVLAFVAGTIVTYLAVVGGMFWYIAANNIFDRDGGMSMGIVFILGPVTGLIGGAICAVAVAIWIGRRNKRPAAGAAAPRQGFSQAQRIGLAMLLAGVPVYLVARFVLWLKAGMSFESYWTALAVSFAPIVLAVAAAALAGYWVSRMTRPQT